MQTVTLTLSAPKFGDAMSWTAPAIVHMLQQTLAERCDLTGVEIRLVTSDVIL